MTRELESLPVGFDLHFPTDLSDDAWFLIRQLQKERQLDELCPSPEHWSYVARTETARRWISHLKHFTGVHLFYPERLEGV